MTESTQTNQITGLKDTLVQLQTLIALALNNEALPAIHIAIPQDYLTAVQRLVDKAIRFLDALEATL